MIAISYTTHVSTARDENNIPELDAGIPQTSTTVKRPNDEPIICIIGEYHP